MSDNDMISYEEFARQQEQREQEYAHKRRCQIEENRHARTLAVIWAPVVALVLLSFLAFLGDVKGLCPDAG